MPKTYWKDYGFEANATSGYFDSVIGPPTIVTSPVFEGIYALEISVSGTTERVQWNPPAGNRIIANRFWIRLPSLPGADVNLMNYGVNVSGDGRFIYQPSSGKFALTMSTGDVAGGPTVATDTWYMVDLEYDISTGTRRLRCKIDGGTEWEANRDVASEDITYMLLGTQNNATYTAYFDNWTVSLTDGDYPLGDYVTPKIMRAGVGRRAGS